MSTRFWLWISYMKCRLVISKQQQHHLLKQRWYIRLILCTNYSAAVLIPSQTHSQIQKKKITWIFHLWIHAFDFICDIEMNITQMQATTIDTLYNNSIFVVVYFFCYCTAFNPYHAHNLFVDLLFFSLFTHIIHAHTFHKIKQQKRT